MRCNSAALEGSRSGFGMIVVLWLVWAATGAHAGENRSPVDVAFSRDGKTLAVADRTAREVVLVDATDAAVIGRVALDSRVGTVAYAADRLLATCYDSADLAVIDPIAMKLVRRVRVGAYPHGIAVARKRGFVLVGNTATADVSVMDRESGKEEHRAGMIREPWSITVTPDQSLAVIGNLLPLGDATNPAITASVSILDLETMRRKDLPLPPNTTAIRGIAISPDGAWAYAVHTVGRTPLPATQLDRGWVNTNAVSVIDLKKREHYATALLDTLSDGAADPWGVAIAPDGKTLWVTIAGTHQLARINLEKLHHLMAGGAEPGAKDLTLWDEIRKDASKRSLLVNDLAALYVAGVMQRLPLPGRGPRGTAISPDGKTLAVAMYFSGTVLLVDADTGSVSRTVSLGDQPEPDDVRRGEAIFHDANYAFQRWLSCATCHPNDARVDGLNWDLPNDGLGNPKNNKSLLQAHLTPPMMWTGVRDTMEVASAAGFKFAMLQPTEQDVKALQAYLRSLKPEKSPFRKGDGSLTESASRGKLLFESEKTHCTQCHSGEWSTNGNRYNVGTQGPLDHPEQVHFDTPSLVEVWRTAPYLHDGRAVTLHEVFTKYNPKDRHGVTSHLSPRELDDLVEYVKSIE